MIKAKEIMMVTRITPIRQMIPLKESKTEEPVYTDHMEAEERKEFSKVLKQAQERQNNNRSFAQSYHQYNSKAEDLFYRMSSGKTDFRA